MIELTKLLIRLEYFENKAHELQSKLDESYSKRDYINLCDYLNLIKETKQELEKLKEGAE